jgi:hypothetical protein
MTTAPFTLTAGTTAIGCAPGRAGIVTTTGTTGGGNWFGALGTVVGGAVVGGAVVGGAVVGGAVVGGAVVGAAGGCVVAGAVVGGAVVGAAVVGGAVVGSVHGRWFPCGFDWSP